MLLYSNIKLFKMFFFVFLFFFVFFLEQITTLCRAHLEGLIKSKVSMGALDTPTPPVNLERPTSAKQ